jgi:hypothetical protein
MKTHYFNSTLERDGRTSVKYSYILCKLVLNNNVNFNNIINYIKNASDVGLIWFMLNGNINTIVLRQLQFSLCLSVSIAHTFMVRQPVCNGIWLKQKLVFSGPKTTE